MSSTNPFMTLVFAFLLLLLGIYFWMKGSGKIKNTNPDYEPSLGIFKICGIIIVVAAVLVFVLSVLKVFKYMLPT